jgi:hypothetical protein
LPALGKEVTQQISSTRFHIGTPMKSAAVLVILQRKLHDTEFAFPSRVSTAEAATDRYQLVVDGEYYSVRWAHQVTKEASYANLNEMPALDIARYLGNRVVRRIKRIGH